MTECAAFHFHNKIKLASSFLAPKTLEESATRIHRERSGTIIMIRKGTLDKCSGTVPDISGVRSDEIHNINFFLELGKILLYSWSSHLLECPILHLELYHPNTLFIFFFEHGLIELIEFLVINSFYDNLTRITTLPDVRINLFSMIEIELGVPLSFPRDSIHTIEIRIMIYQ